MERENGSDAQISNNASTDGMNPVENLIKTDDVLQESVKPGEKVETESKPTEEDVEISDGQVNMAFETETDDEHEDIRVLDRSRSDEHLEMKHHLQTRELVENLKDSPSAVSDVNAKDYVEINNFQEQETPEVFLPSSCTESPGVTSQDDVPYDEDDDDDDEIYYEAAGDERMSLIEEEYIDRISQLERRNFDLEMVLHRLSAAMERLLCLQEETGEQNVAAQGECAEPSDEIMLTTPANSVADELRNSGEEETKAEAAGTKRESQNEPDSAVTTDTVIQDGPEDVTDQPLTDEGSEVPIREDVPQDEAGGSEKQTTPGDNVDSTAQCVTRHICIELFMEFQKKLAMFAGELKGVLSCSESAIRHGRVVQEWGKSVQLMFEQLLHERKKMMNFIDEREKVMMAAREQFIVEKQEQARQLETMVDEMRQYRELMDTTEALCADRGVESSHRRSLAEGVVTLLLQRRLEEERAIILGLARQSKISEMKLFIMHQQNCIQDLQIQNKELRAVIEGLVGPDELSESFDTDQSGTPASACTPERPTVRDTLDKVGNQAISLVSDVLYCDRGQYLPGASTDGDLATVQAYGIGQGYDKKGVDGQQEVVFDPLSVEYVREHCQKAEETERRALAGKQQEGSSVVNPDQLMTSVDDVTTHSSDVTAINKELQGLEIRDNRSDDEKQRLANLDSQDAAGDGVDVISPKPLVTSPVKPAVTSQVVEQTTEQVAPGEEDVVA